MKKVLIILLFGFATVLSTRAGTRTAFLAKDSVQPERVGWNGIDGDKAITAELLDIETGDGASGDQRNAFLRLMRLARTKSAFRTRKIRFRFYSDLAEISARLRLYPIAMKCYYNAVHPSGEKDTAAPAITEGDFPVDSDCDGRRLAPLPEPIQIEDLLAAFDDGREAVAYALLAEVKQPVPGKRKSFTRINNVGHMFITVIKYNKDNSFVCRSFGFYPHKCTLLSATPFCPRSPSVIKDDAGHDWDEAAGKFISPRCFRKIVEILRSYDHRDYDLNRSNCTDFGLTIARVGGIDITDAAGHWPLGKGNNPGSAGQSILEGKISDIDEDYTDPLFVSTNNIPHASTHIVY